MITSIVVILFVLCSTGQLLYDKSSPVIQLDSDNFEKLVLNDDSLWLVEFYADWCGHCKALAPEYIKVADRLKGLIKIGAVNADKEKQLSTKYNVKGYPTLKLFGRDKNTPKDFQSSRNANAIIEAIIKYIKDTALPKKKSTNGKPEKDGDQYILTGENFDSFLKSTDKPVLVKFFAPWCGHCQAMAGDYKEAATDLKDTAYLAKVDATVESELAQRYSIQGFPTLKLFFNKNGNINVVDYTGGRKRDEIKEWVESQVGYVPPRIETIQVSSQKQFDELCLSKIFCIIAFLPPIEDSSEKQRLNYITQLNEASATSTGSNWGWVWIPGGTQDNFEQALHIDGLPYPIVIGLHHGKQVYAVLKTSFNQKNIENFVNELKVGRAHISNFKKLPSLIDSKPWVAQSKSKDEL